ncbi:MAG: indolepyruvate ferredoxin oxidoreductase subunit alpha [Desulfurococcales archaeon ex4484_42]|nr:MAG: indolepyruvate ferredoxin oxidoreductase subunit alpha [Desulfurococcales archaeon ex4484_42]
MGRFKDLLKVSNTKVLLLGNEAIARGAIEAGVGVATAYPGTPSSEIVESLMEVKDELGIYVEWSVNEKVAFEIAYAAAISGVRSLVAMKHVGLNVAADPFMSSAYTGVEEGFVIVSADDPSMWSSQNEQDNRIYGLHGYVPVFETTIVSEVKDLTKYLFDFSSKHKHPVLLRSTTRISHTRAPIMLGEVPRKFKTKGVFKKDTKYVLTPVNARRDKLAMLERFSRIKQDVEKFPFNKIEGSGNKVIIAPGIAYSYVKEVIEEYNLNDVIVVKLTTIYPIPYNMIADILRDVSAIMVIEELEPVVEYQVKDLIVNEGLKVKVYGKDITGLPYELNLNRVKKSLGKFLNVEINVGKDNLGRKQQLELPARPPTFCPGCPYRPLFYAIKMFIISKKLNAVTPGDIGCYALASNEPFKLQDVVIEMGGSLGVGNGFSKVLDDVVIAFIGDSTFFHAGIPPLINAVFNKSRLIAVILDNEVTAMTGHQPSPASKVPGKKRILIEDVAKGVGVRFVKVVDPFKIDVVKKTLEEAIEFTRKENEPAVIVVRRRCALEAFRDMRRAGIEIPIHAVDKNKCIACGICYTWFGCPAITPLPDGKASIDPGLCIGCGACVNVCPVKAIKPVKTYRPEELSKYWF